MSRKRENRRGCGNHIFFMQEIEGSGSLLDLKNKEVTESCQVMQWLGSTSVIFTSLGLSQHHSLKDLSKEPTQQSCRRSSSVFFPRSIIAIMQWIAFLRK